MSIALNIFCLGVPLTMLFYAVLSFYTGVGGFGCPIYVRAVRADVAFWGVLNNPPNSASMADAMTFIMILYSTCMGRFSGCITIIGVLFLGLWPKKKYPHPLMCASVYEMNDAS